MGKRVTVIGAGFAGLAAASFMAKAGWSVTVIEKHATPGGRARQWQSDGFRFDMGPSWYWMPDVFERYFQQFNRSPHDYYQLHRLDPSYRVYWPGKFLDVPANLEEFRRMFESLEPGSGPRLDKFLSEAAFKYRVGMQKLVFKPGRSLREFIDPDVFRGITRLDLFTSIKKHIEKYFRNPQLRQLLEFPVLFLGALPENTPALYSLMNYADIVGGTWYPMGGMYSVVQGMYGLALELGVEFRMDETVTALEVKDAAITRLLTEKGTCEPDVVIGAADYHHVEQELLPSLYRHYDESYWEKRTLAPSCLLYYVGINRKLKGAIHHMLFFDSPFELHASEIYESRQWPTEPLFYVSASSVSDSSTAPEGMENLVFLVPVAAGLSGDSEELRAHYFRKILRRFERHLNEPLEKSIVYYKSFSVSDFSREYNSYRGNAYGLANTLRQTALLKPACRNPKLKNLFYAGQLTVPGPGVPPSLISGEVVAGEVLRSFP